VGALERSAECFVGVVADAARDGEHTQIFASGLGDDPGLTSA
jgi:hypothetical protein